MTVEEIAVKITGDSTSLQSSMKSAEDSLSKFGISLEVMTKVGAVAALKAIGGAALEAATAFAESEKQSLRLNAAISASETIGSSGRRALDDLAASTAKLAGVDDDAVTGMEAMLVSTGRTTDEIDKMMTAALGLSNATGVDLNTALTQINGTFSGTTGRLDKMTPALKDLTEEQLKNGGAVDVLLAKYGSLATALGSSSSASMANYKTQLGNVQEALGSLVEVNLKPLRDGLASVFEWFVNNKAAIVATFIAIEAAVVTLVSLVNPIAGIITGLIAIGSTVVTLGSQMETATTKATDAEKKYAKAVDDVTAGMSRGEKAAFDRAHAGETAAKKKEAQDKIDADKEKQRQKEIGEAREAAQQTYDKSIVITAEKAKAGFLTQEEAAKANFDANSKLINDLYNLGYTTDQKTGLVGSARLNQALTDYQTQSDAFKAAKDQELLNLQKSENEKAKLLSDSLAQEQELKKQADVQDVLRMGITSDMMTQKQSEAHQGYLDWLKEKAIADAEDTAKELKNKQDLAKFEAAAGDEYLKAMKTIGDALKANKSAQEGLVNAVRNLADVIMEQLPTYLLKGGLELLATPAWEVGLGMIAASGLVALSNASGFTKTATDAISSGINWIGEVTGLKKLFGFAEGTPSAPGGLAMVGERGPELVNLPTGSKVYNNSQTTSMLSQANSRTFVFNSPAALSPVETRREFERMSRRLAFEGVA